VVHHRPASRSGNVDAFFAILALLRAPDYHSLQVGRGLAWHSRRDGECDVCASKPLLQRIRPELALGVVRDVKTPRWRRRSSASDSSVFAYANIEEACAAAIAPCRDRRSIAFFTITAQISARTVAPDARDNLRHGLKGIPDSMRARSAHKHHDWIRSGGRCQKSSSLFPSLPCASGAVPIRSSLTAATTPRHAHRPVNVDRPRRLGNIMGALAVRSSTRI